jgi:hypothetical protein
MTKKAMIEKMQLKEAALWLAFREASVSMGEDTAYVRRRRSEWCAINTLMEELGIPTNHLLPDNQKAFEIMMQVMRDKQMIEELEQADFDSRDINS